MVRLCPNLSLFSPQTIYRLCFHWTSHCCTVANIGLHGAFNPLISCKLQRWVRNYGRSIKNMLLCFSLGIVELNINSSYQNLLKVNQLWGKLDLYLYSPKNYSKVWCSLFITCCSGYFTSHLSITRNSTSKQNILVRTKLLLNCCWQVNRKWFKENDFSFDVPNDSRQCF